MRFQDPFWISKLLKSQYLIVLDKIYKPQCSPKILDTWREKEAI